MQHIDGGMVVNDFMNLNGKTIRQARWFIDPGPNFGLPKVSIEFTDGTIQIFQVVHKNDSAPVNL